jgi:RNA polymerase sigma-70 factor (ECF subfamily)
MLQRLREKDRQALAELFELQRPRLARMVRFRMDRRLAARVDADDILQEAFLNAADRIEHWLVDPTRSLFVWFRLIASQTLIDVHRRHIGAEMRDAGREISLQATPQATSVSLAAELIGSFTTPSHAVAEPRRRAVRADETTGTGNREHVADGSGDHRAAALRRPD